MAITEEKLAKLLIGIARAQRAVIQAHRDYLGQDEGFKFELRHVIPALQGASGGIPMGEATLENLPSRVLIHTLAGPQRPQPGKPSQEDWYVGELRRLLAED